MKLFSLLICTISGALGFMIMSALVDFGNCKI